MRADKKFPLKGEKKSSARGYKRGVVGYSKKSALLEDAITHMNAGKYGRSSAALKELLALDPHNTEARRLFATLHLRLGSLVTARQAFESLARESIERQDYWLAESLLREYLAAGPRCVPFLELLAHVYEEKGDAMAAVTEFGKAVDILIEDPDPENPQKPGQLYAKIRALAPASPVALRLATMFDIQTGEILSPHPSPSSSSTQEAVSTSVGDVIQQTQNDGTVDEMPWERIDADPPTVPPVVPSTFEESIEPQVGTDQSVTSSEAGDLPVDAPAELSPEIGQIVQDDVQSSSDRESRDSDTTLSFSAVPPSELEGLQSEPETLPAPPPSDDLLETSIEPGWQEEPPMDSAGPLPSGPLSSPMPWEQVEESTIRISESEPLPSITVEQAPLPATTIQMDVAPANLAQPEVVSESTGGSNPSEEAPVEAPAPNQALVEPSVEPPALPTEEKSQSPKSAHFSWESIFSKAWSFSATSTDPSPLPEAEEAVLLLEGEPTEVAKGTEIPPPVETSAAPALPSSEPTFLLRESGSTHEVAALTATDMMPIQELQASEPERETEAHIGAASSEPQEQISLVSEEPSLPTEQEATAPSTVMDTGAHEPFSNPEVVKPVTSGPPVDQLSSVTSSDKVVSAQSAASPVEPPPLIAGPSSHWNTGEVAVQHHRPSKKKRQWDKEADEPSPPAPPSFPSFEEPPEADAASPPEVAIAESEPAQPSPTSVTPEEDVRPDWERESDSITFLRQDPPTSSVWESPVVDSAVPKMEPSPSAAASAVDVLFDSAGTGSHVRTHDRIASTIPRPRLAARLHRVRIGISSFIGSCFSTTRSLVISLLALVGICALLVVAGIGTVGIAWMVMEVSPNAAYQNLTTRPQRSSVDIKKNGYFLLLGFDAPQGRDALQAGYERKVDDYKDLSAARACLKGDEARSEPTASASSSVIRGWLKNADPVARFKGQTESIRSWTNQESSALGRYQQWLKLPFEDWGFGELASPNCAQILLAHRLYLAEGFSQDLATGFERLELDMAAWRSVLAQSKTLMVKMLAADAVVDDIAIVSGLLVRTDLDDVSVARLGKIVRPFDQVELSVRWPMQSHFTWGTKTVKTALKEDKAEERPLYVSLAASMPLPVQRRFNSYAEYYEAANRAVAEGRYTNLPNPNSFLRLSASNIMDYLANPLEHIIGIEPLPSWDPYVGRIVETDARLRLASLQAWFRRGPQEGGLLTRLARAGQSHYDPFTGFPMLVNYKKGVIYSVGRDGKDQEADPLRDVVALIPPTRSEAGESSRPVGSTKSK